MSLGLDSSMDLVPLRLAEHKAFLRLVHSAPGGGDELYLGRALPGAIERYLKCWLPLVARVGGGAQLIPPLDIAWVWHLHRLAPRRYAAYCTDRFGRVLDPGAAAFQAQSAVSETDSETQQLWQKHVGDEPFFQRPSEDEGSPAGWGPRDPLSNQTTLRAELKEACESVRSAHGFDYDVETCSARQRTFLWQISQPAFSEGCSDFSGATTARYLQFLGLMKKHGYDQHFFVPSYDIDFAWHTHMLASTSAYLWQTEALAAVPGGVDHDDSVNQRHEGSKLHLGWGETKELWALDYGDTAEPIEKSGVTYRGEPPDWWFKSNGADIFRVCDGFLTDDEVAAALEKLSCEANIRGRAHSGFDMVCQVSVGVWRRLREQLEAERTVAGQAPQLAGQESQLAGQADLPAQVAAGQEEEQVEEQGPVEVPARVCPASKSVPQHKDKPDGKGAAVSSWITLVYLTHQPGSALVLVDDVTGCEYRVAIEPGRLVSWPNARFSHRVDVDDVLVAQDAVPAQGAELASSRCMLGPMAFTQAPGPSLSGKQIVYTEGGCGGGGGGGGGCGFVACGGGGGGGSIPAIKENATRRIVGTSTMATSVMRLEKGTADASALTSTFVPAVYNATYRTTPRIGPGSTEVVAYMQEAQVSQAYWQQLQLQIRAVEAHLAQIANLSEPPSGYECSYDACCGGLKASAFAAVAALIEATRDVHVACMNMEQLAARGVSLRFGGSNSAYYLEPMGGRVRRDVELQSALRAAQAVESAARADVERFNITLPTFNHVAPGPQTMSAPGPQTMMVQVPVGFSGGQSLQVQTPAGLMAVQIPPGLTAGQYFQMQVPAQPTQPPTAEQMQRAP